MHEMEQVRSIRKSFTRLARFITQLMREQMTCGPITVQQCYTLEALCEGPKNMKELAGEVALHQSTLTRIVEKLEKLNLVRRSRPMENQRIVEVTITGQGRKVYQFLEQESEKTVSVLLDQVPADKRDSVVDSMEFLTTLLDPGNEAFRSILQECCCRVPDNGGDFR